jgi:spore coat polysaccharide biosynthesis protein SpsF (cytidylyltransferase family)
MRLKMSKPNKMNEAIFIQARMGSKRRPEKVLKFMQGEPMLAYQVKRLRSAGLKNIYIVTTNHPQDDILAGLATELGINYFRGAENDVLSRFVNCARQNLVDTIIRLGGDDPLVDPNGILVLSEMHKDLNADFIYASHPSGWIYGTAAELVTLNALETAHKRASSAHDREHVVSYLRKSSDFKSFAATPSVVSQIRPDIFLSVDYEEDLELVEQIIGWFTERGRRYSFNQNELIELYDSGEITIKNKHLHSGF